MLERRHGRRTSGKAPALLILALAVASPVRAGHQAAEAAPKLAYGDSDVSDADASGAVPRLSYAFGPAVDDAPPVAGSVWADPPSLPATDAPEPSALRTGAPAEQKLAGLVTSEAARPAPSHARPVSAAPYWARMAGEPRAGR